MIIELGLDEPKQYVDFLHVVAVTQESPKHFVEVHMSNQAIFLSDTPLEVLAFNMVVARYNAGHVGFNNPEKIASESQRLQEKYKDWFDKQSD